MDEKNQNFEKSIKKIHSFGFTPKYQEEFSIKIKPRIFLEITIKTFEALNWDIVFMGDNQIEAKIQNKLKVWSHKVIIKINNIGKVNVKSESLGNEIWDIGKNSKKVKLFIYTFNEIIKNYDENKLVELEKELEKKDNWDDYEIPKNLPSPKKFIQPQILVPVLGIGIISLILSYIIALLSLEGFYIIGLFEIITGTTLGFFFKILMKLGNFTNWKKIRFILIGAVILILIMNNIIQYYLILIKMNSETIEFLEFIKLRLKRGLIIQGLSLGSIGLFIYWIIQMGLIYLIGYSSTISAILKISTERVPPEVINFAMYHSAKGKNKHAIKQELYKMGWKTNLEHDMVFEAVDGILSVQDINRY